ARQDLLARDVAVKVYKELQSDGDGGPFFREAAAAGRLSGHPGIVAVYDGGVLADSAPYLIMELCPGGSLTSWLTPENRRPEDQVRLVGARVADALTTAHSCRVIHRDVKPANVLIDAFGQTRLTDFGLAALDGTEATADDVRRLTPAYAPPEAFGQQQPSEAGDVFSLGATLYALLAGSPPRRVDVGADLEQILATARRPIQPIPGVNWFLMDVLLSALSDDPGDRPTAAELRDQLSEVPTARLRRRSPAIAAVGGVAPAVAASYPVIDGAARSATGAATAVDPSRHRRHRPRRAALLAAAATLVAVAIPGTIWWADDSTSSKASTGIAQGVAERGSTAENSPTPATAEVGSPSPPRTTVGRGDTIEQSTETISLAKTAQSARPFETLPVRGSYSGGADTFVRVQRWEGGDWRAFPVPAKTSRTGEFTVYVELAQPRRYRLRVADPQTGVASAPFDVVVRAD
ncbi:MAG TPA: protein kinase, partial [Microlunatus sp.]|nr:protein kinase [Microlunatus sp.]